jgi:hypothetical protein
MKHNFSKIPSDYQGLLRKVKETLIEGQQRIEAERVRTYWETGRLIHGHVLKFADRAEYGAEVVANVARDLNVDRSLLTRCVQFAKRYPQLPIGAGRHKFNWAHYRQLITITDEKERLLLERTVVEKDWTAEELEQRLKSKRSSEPEAGPSRKSVRQTPLTPLRGELYTYRLTTRPTVGAGEDSGLLIDLGFGIFREIDDRWKDGDIVQSRPREDAYKFSKIEATAKDLFTYIAYVERVVDGDTIKVRFDLGFETFTRQTLRLRGIDCPEMDTKAGQEAKAFVQSYIKEAQRIIVRSSRSDKYDRYLADIFIPSGNEPEPATDLFLNNLLLERGHAQRM